jgi:glycerophosphoryl diester phosphodiesterase
VARGAELFGLTRHPAGGGRPVVIGHRGVRREGLVENTLPAFAEAAREGADAVELDVRACASGELVVTHDPTLERITEGADLRAIAELTLEDLGRVTLPGGARVPSLAEVLAFARERRLGVNVEMKRDAPSRTAIVRAVARLLGRWDTKHAVLVSSFDPAMLSGLRLLLPEVPLAVLVHRTRWHLAHAAVGVPVGATAVHLERTLTRPELLAGLAKRGFAVNVWTVNDPGEARDLAALGVNGLITDTPGAVRAALGG